MSENKYTVNLISVFLNSKIAHNSVGKTEKDRQHGNFIFLRKNLTNAVYMLSSLYSHSTLIHVSVFKGPSSGITDTFCELCQQNMCP